MIALVPEPFSGTHATLGPIMLIGFNSEGAALIVDGDGSMHWMRVSEIKIDWRYDWKRAAWVDVSPYEDIDDDEEAPDDRGEEISGDLPDAD